MTDSVHPDPGILLYTRIKKSPYYYGARRHGVKLYSVYNQRSFRTSGGLFLSPLFGVGCGLEGERLKF